MLLRTSATSLMLRRFLNMSNIESSKRLAAYASVDNHVKDGYVVGIGSGSTIVYAVERLKERVRDEGIRIRCIPTSFQAKRLLYENNLAVTSLETDPQCDVTIDGCDEADDYLTLIKGGGGCLAQEKVLAQFSNLFVVIADYRKNSAVLGSTWKYVPVEVLPLAYEPVRRLIQTRWGGTVQLRMAKAKAGPVVTDNGNFILDWYFEPERSSLDYWRSVNSNLCCTAGVVETGIFINMASIAYFGQEDGSVKTVKPKNE